MQIPIEWYPHILPGIVIICSFLVVYPGFAAQIRPNLEKHMVGSAVALAICSYLIGLFENALILYIVRPIAQWSHLLDPPPAHSTQEWVGFYLVAHQSLIDAINSGYHLMLLYRSMLGALVCLALSILFSLSQRTHRALRIVAIVVVTLVAYSVFQQWWTSRMTYIQFVNESLQSTHELLQKPQGQ
jgi:hypothetical protein